MHARCAGPFAKRETVPTPGEPHVLVSELQGKARRVVLVGEKPVIEAVERAPAPAGTSAHGFPQGERLDPGLDAHREHLRQNHLDAVARRAATAPRRWTTRSA